MTRYANSIGASAIKSRRSAIAAAVMLVILGGCGKDREEATVLPPGPETTSPVTTTKSAPVDPEKIERYSEEMREPERDTSIDDNASVAAETAQFAMIDGATAKMSPTDGNETFGTVRFHPTDDKTGMLVTVDISGLKPGKHGFHIHENGDCSAPDATSAGGHYNPYQHVHGAPDDNPHHLGDLGNVEANEEGRVNVEFEVPDLAFSGPASILQKALIIHAGADDLKTDPAGNSGDRVGCGVILQESEVLANPTQLED